VIDRPAEVRRILVDGIAPFELRESCDEEWLATYPGGFGPMPTIESGDVLRICVERIVAHGGALLDDQFKAFCQAIHAWQSASAMDYALELAPDLIVAKFMQDLPSAGRVLSLVAMYVGIPLVEFLGAGRGEPVTLHVD
jgi:hypothetical protein